MGDVGGVVAGKEEVLAKGAMENISSLRGLRSE